MSTKVALSLAFLSCLLLLAECGSPCPPAAEILPCNCVKDGPDTVVDCKYHNDKLLKLAFDRLSKLDTIVDVMRVSSSHLTLVNTSFFQDMTVRAFSIRAERWTRIDDNAFDGQQISLEKVHILQSELTSVPIEALNILEVLTEFRMLRSEVNAIPDKAFADMDSAPSLEEIDLRDNYIKVIGSNAFTGLDALKRLFLDGNRISHLPAQFLPKANKIEWFSIRSNEVEALTSGIDTFPETALLDFSDNKIRLISAEILRSMMVNKLFVNFTDNPLRCDCNMQILTSSAAKLTIAGTCRQPSKRDGISLQSLKPSDFSDCSNNLRKALKHI